MLGILRLEFYMKIQARAGKTYACIIDKAGKTNFCQKEAGFFKHKVCGHPVHTQIFPKN